MNLFMSTATSLMLVYSGTAGVEVLLSRYATPDARAARCANEPDGRATSSTPLAEMPDKADELPRPTSFEF